MMTSEPALLITLTTPTATPGMVKRLARQGATGVRLIAKGYKAPEFRITYDALLAAGREEREDFRVIVDLPGGKPRVSSKLKQPLDVRAGMRLILCGEDSVNQASDTMMLPTVGLAPFITYFEPHDRIFVSDGSIQMRYLGKTTEGIEVRVEYGDTITASRSINIPDTVGRSPVELTYTSRGDDDGVLVAFDMDSDVEVAVSMAASVRDVQRIRNLLPDARVLAKIESKAGLKRLDEIANAADELIVARADLYIEVGPSRIGADTCAVVAAARRHGKPVTVAAGLLDQVRQAENPSIAEASEFWYLWREGINRFLLSGSVSVNRPLEAAHAARSLMESFADFAAQRQCAR